MIHKAMAIVNVTGLWGGLRVLLADLKTNIEREAFASLAYSVANADGSLDYAEITLIKLYLEEMGMDYSGYQSQREPLINLCHVFSDRNAKRNVFINLLSLAFVDGYNNLEQRQILEVIQRELDINSMEVQRYEDEMKIIKGSYFPHYFD